MKNIIIMMLMALVCQTTSFAQKLTIDKVPATVLSAFKVKFPAATQQSWEMEGKGYEANFMSGTKKQSATFDKNGKWLETETTITSSALPKPISEALYSEYAGFKTQEISEIESAEKGNFYEIEVAKAKERYELSYSSSGHILKKKTLKE